MRVAEDFEQLMIEILKRVKPSGSDLAGQDASAPQDLTLEYQRRQYNLAAPWERISVAEAFAKYAEIDTETMLDEAKLKVAAKAKGYQVSGETTWEEVWNQIIANEIEPKLGITGPTILFDYPVAQAALAKKAKDPRFAERWEVFMAGVELGNCFSELTDAAEQESRCKADLLERKHLGKTEYPMDTDFIEALKMGMSETGGIAVGVDRLVMLFADARSVADVLFFPSEEMFD
jgi:lysyl-tRNA synthetase class 2